MITSAHIAYLLGYALILSVLQATYAEPVRREDAILQAGASTSNITPFLGDGPGKGWIKPGSAYIHDDFNARCLVLDNGTTRVLFVTVDDMGVNAQLVAETKRLINKETGLPIEAITISSTHTHSSVRAHGGPPFNDYQLFIKRRIADGARKAIHNLEPARIGWGVGSVPQHVSVRRWIMRTPQPNPFGGQDKVKTNPPYDEAMLGQPAGKTDPEVSFISVQARNGRPIALLANYSLHYVGGVPSDHLSADYFPVFADRVGELLGADRQDPAFVGIMSNGTSGNINHLFVARTQKRYRPYEQMREVADDIAQEVIRVHKTIQYHEWVPLQALQEKIVLKTRKPDQQMVARAKQDIAKADPAKRVYPRDAERILSMMNSPDELDVLLQAFRVGDLGITTIPFEVFAEIGMELKARNPFHPSFTISMANGYNGYLPTPEQHKLGGYETWLGTNRVQVDASQIIVERLLVMLGRLK